MSFLFTTIRKIVIFFILFLIPVGLFISFFSLYQDDIPVWNIGIRNLLVTARNLTVPIIAVSFLLSVLFTVSLIDKMKVRSIFVLHVPALFIGAVVVWIFYGSASRSEPLHVGGQDVRLGYLSFFREGVFTDAGEKTILMKTHKGGPHTFYIFDRTKGTLTVLPMAEIGPSRKTGGKPENRVIIDRKNKDILFQSGGKTVTAVPFREFRQGGSSIDNPLVGIYVDRLKKTLAAIRARARNLHGTDLLLFLSMFFLSVIMIALPLTYALNDGGWGF
jgi:hypothetical protein